MLIRCDLLGQFGVVGFLPLLPLHGWFAVLDRVAFLPTPGLRELKRRAQGNVLLMWVFLPVVFGASPFLTIAKHIPDLIYAVSKSQSQQRFRFIVESCT